MYSSCNAIRTTVGLPLPDHIVSQVQGQTYSILTKYTMVNQMLKFGGSHTFLGGFTAATQIWLIRIFGGSGGG